MNDGVLLQEFARQRSETAFAELVRRHGKLVYSCARQRVGDPHAAADIAQSVFLALAIKAPSLPADISLPGWLYRATRFAAAKYQRAEQGRREREMKAHQDQQLQGSASENTAEHWQEIQPHLTAALDGLPATDREAVLLRFYGESSYRQVGQSLRVSEEAAKKRVARALERLRHLLAKRGVSIGTGALASVLGVHAAEAMPVAVAVQSVKTAAAVAGGTMAATETLMLAKGALHAMFIAKVKTVSLAAAACLVVAGTSVVAAKQLSRSTLETSQPAPIQVAANSRPAQAQTTALPAVSEASSPRPTTQPAVAAAAEPPGWNQGRCPWCQRGERKTTTGAEGAVQRGQCRTCGFKVGPATAGVTFRLWTVDPKVEHAEVPRIEELRLKPITPTRTESRIKEDAIILPLWIEVLNEKGATPEFQTPGGGARFDCCKTLFYLVEGPGLSAPTLLFHQDGGMRARMMGPLPLQQGTATGRVNLLTKLFATPGTYTVRAVAGWLVSNPVTVVVEAYTPAESIQRAALAKEIYRQGTVELEKALAAAAKGASFDELKKPYRTIQECYMKLDELGAKDLSEQLRRELQTKLEHPMNRTIRP